MCRLDDDVLVERFVRNKSEEAFRALSNRYVRLVYGVCKRRLGRSDLAEDATQAVFLVLVRKASRLLGKPSIANWLYTCALQVSATSARSESNRLRREKLAMHPTDAPPHEVIDDLSNLLDVSLGRLGQKDREAIVLRYLESKSFVEIGRLIGLHEDAARMRVNRAVEKLRAELGRGGLCLTSAELEVSVPLVIPIPPDFFDVGTLLSRNAPVHIVKLAKGGRRVISLSHPLPYIALLALTCLGGAHMLESDPPTLVPMARKGVGVMTATLNPQAGQIAATPIVPLTAGDALGPMISLFPGTWNLTQTTSGPGIYHSTHYRATVLHNSNVGSFDISATALDGSPSKISTWQAEPNNGTYTYQADDTKSDTMKFVSGTKKPDAFVLGFEGKESLLSLDFNSRRFSFTFTRSDVPGSGGSSSVTVTSVFTK